MINNNKKKAHNKDFARTKIVGTLGPKSQDSKTIEKMIYAGLDVVRLNFSHNSHQWHEEIFNKVRDISDEITILFDLQGPKIRVGELEKKVQLSNVIHIKDSGY